MGRLVMRIEHGKRINVKIDGKSAVLIKPIKKRSVKNGSRRSQWHLVIDTSVDKTGKPA